MTNMRVCKRLENKLIYWDKKGIIKTWAIHQARFMMAMAIVKVGGYHEYPFGKTIIYNY